LSFISIASSARLNLTLPLFYLEAMTDNGFRALMGFL